VESFKASGFSAVAVNDAETAQEMKTTLDETGWQVCPHTAVGLHASRHNVVQSGKVDIILSTAHAAKFPETIQEVLGQDAPLPARSEAFTSRPEVFETGEMSYDYVLDRMKALSRAAL
jgi:threonine synthase